MVQPLRNVSLKHIIFIKMTFCSEKYDINRQIETESETKIERKTATKTDFTLQKKFIFHKK